jgi:hypothetical protein
MALRAQLFRVLRFLGVGEDTTALPAATHTIHAATHTIHAATHTSHAAAHLDRAHTTHSDPVGNARFLARYIDSRGPRGSFARLAERRHRNRALDWPLGEAPWERAGGLD